MDFGIAETGIARGSLPGITTEVLRFGDPFAEIRVVSGAWRSVRVETESGEQKAARDPDSSSSPSPWTRRPRRSSTLPAHGGWDCGSNSRELMLALAAVAA
jgi:hypothetical protein